MVRKKRIHSTIYSCNPDLANKLHFFKRKTATMLSADVKLECQSLTHIKPATRGKTHVAIVKSPLKSYKSHEEGA